MRREGTAESPASEGVAIRPPLATRASRLKSERVQGRGGRPGKAEGRARRPAPAKDADDGRGLPARRKGAAPPERPTPRPVGSAFEASFRFRSPAQALAFAQHARAEVREQKSPIKVATSGRLARMSLPLSREDLLLGFLQFFLSEVFQAALDPAMPRQDSPAARRALAARSRSAAANPGRSSGGRP
jgi:hypothetical protein